MNTNNISEEEMNKLKNEFYEIKKEAEQAAQEVKKLHEHLPEIIKGLSRPGIDFNYDPKTGKISVNFTSGEVKDDDFDE